MKLVIRDDDCNYFTRIEDIEIAYSEIPNFPVSFAVVPEVLDVLGGCPETNGNTVPKPIYENKELVSYLIKRVHEGSCDILLHGISHQYKFPNGVKTPEMLWRETDTTVDLVTEIAKQKKIFEHLFELPINCFVAPSNKIKKKGIEAVYKNEMNYSGIISLEFDREVSWKSAKNYLIRWFVRATSELPFPGLLDYGTHLELNACNTITYDYLVKMFHYCQKNNMPMAINVHYWHIRDNKEHYLGFFNFIKYAIQNGAEPARMRDCFPNSLDNL